MSRPTIVAADKLHESVVIGGNIRESYRKVLGPSSYDTGGSSFDAKDFGLTFLIDVTFHCVSGDRIAHYIPPSADPVQTAKMLITDLAGTEVTSTTDVSAKVFVAVAKGIT